jgi:hypothetical protein
MMDSFSRLVLPIDNGIFDTVTHRGLVSPIFAHQISEKVRIIQNIFEFVITNFFHVITYEPSLASLSAQADGYGAYSDQLV